MQAFKHYLDTYGEVGYVEKVFQSLVYVRGLPKVRPEELVMFESGEIGQVLSLTPEFVEVILFSRSSVDIEVRVARTNETVSIDVGDFLLGKTISPIGMNTATKKVNKGELRTVRQKPLGVQARKNIHEPFITGVSIVDMVVSLGKGQRELVVGDRKSGKTDFLLQCAEAAVRQGIICIYAAIAKKQADIVGIENHFKERGIASSIAMVASGSSDPTPLVFLTPYTAMTIAEYFRDQGKNTLVILDDMTAHAKYYRELTLLAKRFPGRSSYPGDIFYIHAQLMERAGNFIVPKKGKSLEKQEVSITCLPVAELVMGDLSGYIQTNLMSMTDGHLFFDNNLYNEGRRPAVNSFLSVTRVGRQSQTPLVRSISRIISKFLVRQRDLEQFMHFGAELSDDSKEDLARGELLREIFNQPADEIVPVAISIILIGGLWGGIWKDISSLEIGNMKAKLLKRYGEDAVFKQEIDTLVGSSESFDIFVKAILDKRELFVSI